jgi:colanic acid biosynthesis glycosyl transferase WcaI
MLVPPDDPDALANAIIHMHGNPHEAAVMGFQARRYFEEHLAFRGRYEQFLELFTSVAQASARTERSGR